MCLKKCHCYLSRVYEWDHHWWNYQVIFHFHCFPCGWAPNLEAIISEVDKNWAIVYPINSSKTGFSNGEKNIPSLSLNCLDLSEDMCLHWNSDGSQDISAVKPLILEAVWKSIWPSWQNCRVLFSSTCMYAPVWASAGACRTEVQVLGFPSWRKGTV